MLWLLAPLSLAVLASSLDDLAVDVFWAYEWLRSKFSPAANLFPPGERQLNCAPQRRVAILIPLWREHKVIRNMLEHNLAAIRYDAYDIIAGVYPNDPETQQAVRAVSKRFANVHVAVCPHDGPTSKADCLNWAFQHMLLLEERAAGNRFEVVIIHDAEDLIHADELRWINYYSARFDFIQTPVLPLATPLPAPLGRRAAPTFALGNRDCASRLAKVRMAWKPGRGLLAVARSQGTDWQPHEPCLKYSVHLRATH